MALDINSVLGFQPKTRQVSQVFVSGASGHGSVGSSIRKFIRIQQAYGTAIVYRPSFVTGDTFEINQAGIYAMTYCDSRAVAGQIAITVDQQDLTLSPSSVPISQILTFGVTVANSETPITVVAYLKEGAKIRACFPTADATADNSVNFRICQIVAT